MARRRWMWDDSHEMRWENDIPVLFEVPWWRRRGHFAAILGAIGSTVVAAVMVTVAMVG